MLRPLTIALTLLAAPALAQVVAEYRAGRARERALGALRRVVEVDRDARARRDARPRHLEAVELRRRLEDGARVRGV